MPTKTLAGTSVEVNDEGFFVDASPPAQRLTATASPNSPR